jgi:hypothetical protein
MLEDWQRATLDEIADTVSVRGHQAQTKDYGDEGQWPIIDQGQSKVVGYTDLYEPIRTPMPLVLFGDHTRIVKLIEEPFVVGADGVKLLTPKPDRADSAFLHVLVTLAASQISSLGYSRHFKELKEVVLPLPPLVEQRKIAAILRTWDEAIDKLQSLRAAKERRHRALTHSLVFGTRQLDRFRTTDEVEPHRWLTLPASWHCKPIGQLAKEISERNPDAERYEVLSCSKYDGFVRSLEYFKKQVFSADLTGYKKIWGGDFGFPSNHVEEGSIGLQNLTDVGLVSPIYTVFRFAPEKVDADYAFSVLKTGLYRHIFEVSTSASVDRRGSLRWREFSRLPFPVPSLAEQKAIAEVLRTAQADLAGLTAETDTLTRQKRGLMQKLLTGEWRVTVDAAPPSNLAKETANAG